jgi:hypothetical protein
MSRLIFILQEKGGEWKSTLAVHLAHHLRSIGHSFLLADLDFEDRLFTRYDPGCKAYSPDATKLAARDSNVLDLVYLMRQGSNILIDCGGNSLGCWDVLFQIEPTLLEDLEQKGTKITLIVPVSDNYDTQQYVSRYDEIFGPRATKVLAAAKGVDVRKLASFPGYREDRTFVIPRMPDCLALMVDALAKPAGVISAMEPATLPFPVGFARDADRQFSAAFTRMIEHLKP